MMKKILATLGGFLAGFGTASAAWAQVNGPYGEPHMWAGGWYGWFMGPLMMIVFLAVTVVIVVLIVRWLSGSGRDEAVAPRTRAGPTPLDILEERFARGEIDKDEFEERRRLLEK